MTIQVLFIQGAGPEVHENWDSRLAESLRCELGEGYCLRYPRMPDEANPIYSHWKAELLREFRLLREGAILVGHSVGGTILLHTLAEEPSTIRPAALVLIAAPFIGKGGWSSDEVEERASFADLLPKGLPVFLYHGTGDQIVPVEHTGLHARAIPHSVTRLLDHRDHQMNNSLKEIAKELRSLPSTPQMH